jgi:hypothetical protein
MLYYIYQDGQRITSIPMTLQQINALYGNTYQLERKGFRLVQINNVKKGTV